MNSPSGGGYWLPALQVWALCRLGEGIGEMKRGMESWRRRAAFAGAWTVMVITIWAALYWWKGVSTGAW